MRNEEFEVARDLIAGRAPESRGQSYASHSLAPATFREIDGEILARQYVAHRKFLETEAMAQRFGNAEEMQDIVRATALRAERRNTSPRGSITEAQSAGWLMSLARIFWRR